MHKLFFWLNYHNGDLVLCRPLVRQILSQHDVEITWGCWNNQAYLVEDLPVRVIADPQSDKPFWEPTPLTHLSPPNHIPIYLWIAAYPDTRYHLWEYVVEIYNRQVRQYGVPQLQISSRWVPMVDFPAVTVEVADNAVFVENSKPRAFHSDFQFDLARYSREFPDLVFYCTADPGVQAPNIVDASKLNLVQLSSLSNKCIAIIGIGSGPFCSTLTEPNRYKPRAIMRFHPPQAGHVLWNYPGNPMHYLETQEELFRFLNIVRRQRKISLLPGKPPQFLPHSLTSETLAANLDLQLQRCRRNPADGPLLTQMRPVRDRLAEVWHSIPDDLLEWCYRGAWGKTFLTYLVMRSQAVRAGGVAEPPLALPMPEDFKSERPDGVYSPASTRYVLKNMLMYMPQEIPISINMRLLPEWLRKDFMNYGLDKW